MTPELAGNHRSARNARPAPITLDAYAPTIVGGRHRSAPIPINAYTDHAGTGRPGTHRPFYDLRPSTNRTEQAQETFSIVADTDEIRALTTHRHPDDWTDLDTRAVDTARILAADAVQKCGSGHPGTAMSLAPLAYTLFQRVMRHDPTDTDWAGRDRFVLSCGHSSLTLYIQLYLGGFGLELSDIEALRTWDSLTPGHPEFRHTRGVEITTGPLGQGLASSVGMAMAARRERGLFDPDAAPDLVISINASPSNIGKREQRHRAEQPQGGPDPDDGVHVGEPRGQRGWGWRHGLRLGRSPGIRDARTRTCLPRRS